LGGLPEAGVQWAIGRRASLIARSPSPANARLSDNFDQIAAAKIALGINKILLIAPDQQ
jgi:hypothetical protein